MYQDMSYSWSGATPAGGVRASLVGSSAPALSQSTKDFNTGRREIRRKCMDELLWMRQHSEENENMWSKEAGHPLGICLQGTKGPLEFSGWPWG